MVFKDLESLTEAYALILTETKKTKKPDKDGDGVPDWADKHPGKDDKKTKSKTVSKKKPAFMKEETSSFKELFKKIISEKEYNMSGAFSPEPINPRLEQARDRIRQQREIRDCESAIMRMASGEFHNEPEDVINQIKNCSSIFSVSKDSEGRYTVIIKDEAIKQIEQMYPNLKGAFKSYEECKKDVAKCRAEKL